MNYRTSPNIAGIARNGASGNYTYSVIGSPNHPITYVSFGDAARFANWLQNGQPSGDEGVGTTETGAYTLNGAIAYDTLGDVNRNFAAKWFIPNENEWYKAAYYDPRTGHYWKYATGADTLPMSALPGSTPNTANVFDGEGYAVTPHSTGLSNTQNYLTDVGAYTSSASPYGTFDQSGGVVQWSESFQSYRFRLLKGASWMNGSGFGGAFFGGFGAYSPFEDKSIGFRVAAAVPEPSSGVLAILAYGATVWFRRRFSA